MVKHNDSLLQRWRLAAQVGLSPRYARIARIADPGFAAECEVRVGYNAAVKWRTFMRGMLVALQLLAAFFLTILGLAMAFRAVGTAIWLGSLLAAMGLSFLSLLAINLRKLR